MKNQYHTSYSQYLIRLWSYCVLCVLWIKPDIFASKMRTACHFWWISSNRKQFHWLISIHITYNAYRHWHSLCEHIFSRYESTSLNSEHQNIHTIAESIWNISSFANIPKLTFVICTALTFRISVDNTMAEYSEKMLMHFNGSFCFWATIFFVHAAVCFFALWLKVTDFDAYFVKSELQKKKIELLRNKREFEIS